MEDDSGSNGDGNADPNFMQMGEMTSITAEGKGTGVCSYLKNTLHYIVYVLYVDYNPVSDASYYSYPGPRQPNAYTTADYSGYSNVYNTSTQNLASGPNSENGPAYETAPIYLALQACASSPSDFKEANDADSIQTDLGLLLKQALASTIRLTN